jgi:hypothetical protein
MVERRMLAERQVARQARLAEINAVKSTLPPQAFKTPISSLDLPDEVIEALQPLENVGEIMWRFLIDEDRLRQMLKDLPDDSLALVQSALDRVVIPESDVVPVEPAETPAAEPLAEAVVLPAEAEEGEVVGVFGDEELIVEAPAPAKPQPARRTFEPAKVVASDEDEEEDNEDVLLGAQLGGKKDKEKKKKGNKERQQRRQLIFDEEIGQVIARRRRKGGRGGDWDDEE